MGRMIACAAAVLFTAGAFADDGRELPEGMRGFSGVLRGKVTEKVDNGFRLQVQEVVKVWEGNKAAKPADAVGLTLLVNVQWRQGDGGAWHPVEQHLRFVRSLEAGETVAVEAVNDEGGRLHILELSKEQLEKMEQREAAREKKERAGEEGRKKEGKKEGAKKEEKAPRGEKEGEGKKPAGEEGAREKALEPQFPAGIKGFCGTLRGVVVGKAENGFLLKVGKVVNLWKKNEAKDPRSVVGSVVLVNVQWRQGDGGNRHPDETHTRFVNGLAAGQEISIEVQNDEAERLHILELTKEQRGR